MPGQAPNPLTAMTGYADLMGQMNRNMLFQQEFTANRALGELAQASVDPQSGQLDYDKYGRLISMDPRTSYKAGPILENLINRKYVNSQLLGQNLKNDAEMFTAVGDTAASLVGTNVKNGMWVGDDQPLIQAVSNLSSVYPELRDHGLELLTTMKNMDPGARAQALQTLAMQSQMHGRNMNDVFRTTMQKYVTPTGAAGEMPGITEPGTGAFRPGGVDIGSMFAPQGGPPSSPAVVNGPGGAQTQEVMPSPEGPTPQAPPAGAAQPGSAGGQFPMLPGPGGTMGIQTGLSPFETARQEAAGAYNKELMGRMQTSNQLLVRLGQIQPLLDQVRTGGLEYNRAELARLAQGFGAGEDFQNKLAGGKLGSTQALEKYFLGLAWNQAIDLIHGGGGRIAAQEIRQFFERGSPNLDLDPKAIRLILGGIKQVADLTQLEGRTFNKYVGEGQDPAQWATSIWPQYLKETLARRHAKGGALEEYDVGAG
jgi:hypothetical protein